MNPIHEGHDENGPYYQYGTTGKKYRFDANNRLSRDRAHEKARKQEKAILESRMDRGMSREEAEKKTFGHKS